MSSKEPEQDGPLRTDPAAGVGAGVGATAAGAAIPESASPGAASADPAGPGGPESTSTSAAPASTRPAATHSGPESASPSPDPAATHPGDPANPGPTRTEPASPASPENTSTNPDPASTRPATIHPASPESTSTGPRLDRHAVGQLVFGIISVAVGVAALIDAAGLAKFGKGGQPGPGLFPDLIAALLVVLGAWLAILTVVRPVKAEPAEPVEPGGFKRAATVWLAFVVSIPLLVLFGFAPAMAALVAFLVFGVERIRGFRPVLAVVLVPAVVYLLFSVVLGVDLPESVLFPV